MRRREAVDRPRTKWIEVKEKPRPHCQMMRKRVSKEQKAYVYRMGYQMAVANYVPDEDCNRFSGSSLNRKNKSSEYKKLETLAPRVGETISEQYEYQQAINDLRADIAAKHQYQRKLSDAYGKCKKSIHILSPRSKGKVRDKCTAFFRATPRKRVFATLTFIQTVSDELAVGILNKMLTALRFEFKNFQYIWVAERQEQTGNVHFHMIINRRIPIERYNALWVQQQYNAGLRYKDVTPAEIAERVRLGTVGKLVNPVDVKKITRINALVNYLTKYVTKQKQSGKYPGFRCAAWHCSRGVSRQFTSTVISRSTFALTASDKNTWVNRQTGELHLPRIDTKQFYTIHYIVNRSFFLQFLREMEQINKWILDGWLPDEIPKVTNDDFRKYYLTEN